LQSIGHSVGIDVPGWHRSGHLFPESCPIGQRVPWRSRYQHRVGSAGPKFPHKRRKPCIGRELRQTASKFSFIVSEMRQKN
jgi:hypothetical protein